MTVAQAQGLRSRSAHLTWILGSDSSTEGTEPGSAKGASYAGALYVCGWGGSTWG